MYRLYESSRTKESGRTSTNLYLQYKWDVMNYENHRYNVRTVKSRVDNGAPRTFPHLYYKPKKVQLELERFCAIQRNNKLLLDRLATIQKKGGWTDNKNFHEIKSMNTWKRQQEMIDLAYNNQAVLNRLLDCRSQYNHNKLEDEYMLSRKHKANVEKFPKDWRKIKNQMKCIRKRIKEKVVRTRTGKLIREDDGEENERLAIEKEALQMEKEEEKAKKAKEAEDKERLAESERLKNIKARRRAMAEWAAASNEWRKTRDERLQLIEERKKEEEQKLAAFKEREERKQKKRREKIKKELVQWRQWKVENEINEMRSGKEAVVNYKTPFYKTKRKYDSTSEKQKTSNEDTSASSSNESDGTSNVYREERQKVEEVGKATGEDLKTGSITEKTTEFEQKSPTVTTVFIEGGTKEIEVEEEVLEDLRADLTHMRATKPHPEAKEEPPKADSVVLEGGEKEEEIVDEPSTGISSTEERREQEMLNEKIIKDTEANASSSEAIQDSSVKSFTKSKQRIPISAIETRVPIDDLEKRHRSLSKSSTRVIPLEDKSSGSKITESKDPDIKDIMEKVLKKEITEDEAIHSKVLKKPSKTKESDFEDKNVRRESQIELTDDNSFEVTKDFSGKNSKSRSIKSHETTKYIPLGLSEKEEKDFEVVIDLPKKSSECKIADVVPSTSRMQRKSESEENFSANSSNNKSENVTGGPTEISEEKLERVDGNVTESISNIRSGSSNSDEKEVERISKK